ncbi:hypothetical protein [Kineococcus indalonis]|uniref:hypothetical protein n=1 Tax=Kineococcus indalonis TaxID=2696566 RepID=UPI00196AAAB2|nr:hypothetical protein [Kineococcus indalonis]NAZ84701.1 hypothetical protein [Kineococcus indalonis]
MSEAIGMVAGMSEATSPAPGSDEQLRARFDAIRAAVHEQLRRADAERACRRSGHTPSSPLEEDSQRGQQLGRMA